MFFKSLFQHIILKNKSEVFSFFFKKIKQSGFYNKVVKHNFISGFKKYYQTNHKSFYLEIDAL